MAGRFNPAPLALLLLSGSLVMLFFVILSGESRHTPLRQTYFLRAETAGMSPDARPITQWTFFRVCGLNNQNCSPARPARALGDAWGRLREGDVDGAFEDLIGKHGGGSTSDYYWYMWRFAWVFYLIALFFEVVAWFTGWLGFIGRLGNAVAGLVSTIALVFLTVAVSLMTATFVKLRNAFHDENREAALGRYAFGFSWGSFTALFIATILFCMGMRKSKDGNPRSRFFNRPGRVKNEYA